MLLEPCLDPSFNQEYITFRRPYSFIHFSRNFLQSAQGFEPRISPCLLIRMTTNTQPRSCETSPKRLTTARSACNVLSDHPHPRDRVPTLFRDDATTLLRFTSSA
jgi:hypothetical protein